MAILQLESKREERQDAQIIEINRVIHFLAIAYFDFEKRIEALENRKKR